MCLTITQSHYNHLSYYDNTFNCTRQIMTCEPIDMIYFNFGTGNYEFKCYERSYGILGKPLVLYCTICNNVHLIIFHQRFIPVQKVLKQIIGNTYFNATHCTGTVL